MCEGECGEFLKDSASRVEDFSILRIMELSELMDQLDELSQPDVDFNQGVDLDYDLS